MGKAGWTFLLLVLAWLGALIRSTADELSKLADLHRSGGLTDEEFAAQKAKLLAA